MLKSKKKEDHWIPTSTQQLLKILEILKLMFDHEKAQGAQGDQNNPKYRKIPENSLGPLQGPLSLLGKLHDPSRDLRVNRPFCILSHTWHMAIDPPMAQTLSPTKCTTMIKVLLGGLLGRT